MQTKLTEALAYLAHSDKRFTEIFTNENISVELYKPLLADYQQPHDRDEIYIIVAGTGDFLLGEKRYGFAPGDFFFVPAGVVHRFENFTVDFSTWVIFLNNKAG